MHLKCYQNVSEKKLKKKKIGNIEAKVLSRKRFAEGGKKNLQSQVCSRIVSFQ